MNELTKKQLDDMHHAIGRPTYNKTWKDKTILDKCYRNKFYLYERDESWEDLIKKGLAGVIVQKNFCGEKALFYYVKEEAIKYLRKHYRKTDEK